MKKPSWKEIYSKERKAVLKRLKRLESKNWHWDIPAPATNYREAKEHIKMFSRVNDMLFRYNKLPEFMYYQKEKQIEALHLSKGLNVKKHTQKTVPLTQTEVNEVKKAITNLNKARVELGEEPIGDFESTYFFDKASVERWIKSFSSVEKSREKVEKRIQLANDNLIKSMDAIIQGMKDNSDSVDDVAEGLEIISKFREKFSNLSLYEQRDIYKTYLEGRDIDVYLYGSDDNKLSVGALYHLRRAAIAMGAKFDSEEKPKPTKRIVAKLPRKK